MVALDAGRRKAYENFPGSSAILRAVAARDFACDHGGTKLALGQVVGRVDAIVIEECDEMVALFQKPLPDAFFVWIAAQATQQLVGPRLHLRAPVVTRRLVEFGQDRLGRDCRAKQRAEWPKEIARLPASPLDRLADRYEMMSVALVLDEGGVVVDVQAVADQDAVKVGAKRIVNHFSAPAFHDAIECRPRIGEDPEPPLWLANPPAGFVDVDERGVANFSRELVARGFNASGDSVERLAQTARCQFEAADVFEHGARLAHRQAVGFVELDGDGEGARTKVNAGRCSRGRNLQRMGGNDLGAAVGALPAISDKARDMRAHGRNIFDELLDLFDFHKRLAVAVIASFKWFIDFFVDVVGFGSMRARVSLLTSRLFALLFSFLLRQTKRRSLSFGFASGLLELFGDIGNALIGLHEFFAELRDDSRLLKHDVLEDFGVVRQIAAFELSSAFVVHVALLHGTR